MLSRPAILPQPTAGFSRPLSFSPFFRNSLLTRYPSSRTFTFTSHCNSSEGSNSVKEGLASFRAFGRPFAKVFLGAIFTYQVIYWTWLKLEIDESKLEKNKEILALEKKARDMTSVQK